VQFSEDLMNDTYVTLQGNLGADVRFRDTGKGEVANFSVGATPRYVDRATGAWVDGPTTWYRVSAWRSLARHCADSLHRGDPVFVHGRLSTREWVTEAGVARTDLEVEASFVGHDLNRGTTSFVRSGGGSGLGAGAGGPSGPADEPHVPVRADLPAGEVVAA
jgi:single-strand DNA-binding protein